MGGQRRGSVIAYSREVVKIYLKSAAGYAKYIPLGGKDLFLRIRVVNAQQRLPPAESPAR
jgi:hypothetical protein